MRMGRPSAGWYGMRREENRALLPPHTTPAEARSAASHAFNLIRAICGKVFFFVPIDVI
jgi:hypothetical protein